MNYFYFFAFLGLSVLILIKPITQSIVNKFLELKDVRPLGYITIFIGLLCLLTATNQNDWHQTMWMLVTFIIGVLLVMRGLALLLFADHIKSLVTKIFNNYFRWMRLLRP
jgi:uncharacterized membrane protein